MEHKIYESLNCTPETCNIVNQLYLNKKSCHTFTTADYYGM